LLIISIFSFAQKSYINTIYLNDQDTILFSNCVWSGYADYNMGIVMKNNNFICSQDYGNCLSDYCFQIALIGEISAEKFRENLIELVENEDTYWLENENYNWAKKVAILPNRTYLVRCVPNCGVNYSIIRVQECKKDNNGQIIRCLLTIDYHVCEGGCH
ncbi:MAG: hypothetical protein LBJ72_14815, partial [Dysgonamonadaceae bacterium]|nr:hypothetical protein [Dysgonamonadaceae bacterium]